jgi:hypothetical protein
MLDIRSDRQKYCEEKMSSLLKLGLVCQEQHTIRKIDLHTIEVTTVAGDPTVSGYQDGTLCLLEKPGDVAVGSANNLYFTESSSGSRIRVLHLGSGACQTVAGSGGGHIDGVGTMAKVAFPGPLEIFQGTTADVLYTMVGSPKIAR